MVATSLAHRTNIILRGATRLRCGSLERGVYHGHKSKTATDSKFNKTCQTFSRQFGSVLCQAGANGMDEDVIDVERVDDPKIPVTVSAADAM